MKRSRSCVDLTQLEVDAIGNTSTASGNERLRYRSLSGGSLANGTNKRLKLVPPLGPNRTSNQDPEYTLLVNCRKAVTKTTPEDHPAEELNEVVSRLAIAH